MILPCGEWGEGRALGARVCVWGMGRARSGGCSLGVLIRALEEELWNLKVPPTPCFPALAGAGGFTMCLLGSSAGRSGSVAALGPALGWGRSPLQGLQPL